MQGQFKLRETCSLRLQCWFRSLRAKKIVRDRLYQVMERHFDKAAGREYYFNRVLKTKSFVKPKLLANVEVRQAPDGWQTIKDAAGRTQYYHARRGLYSYYSEDKAAILTQRCFRRKLQGVREDWGCFFMAVATVGL